MMRPAGLPGRLRFSIVLLPLILALGFFSQVGAVPEPTYSLDVSPSQPLDCRAIAAFNLKLIDGRSNQAHYVQVEVSKPYGAGRSQAELVIEADYRGSGSVNIQYPSDSFEPIAGTVATDITGVYTVVVVQNAPVNAGTVATARFTVNCNLSVSITSPLPNSFAERTNVVTLSAVVADVTGPVTQATVVANTPSGGELHLSPAGPGLYSVDYNVPVNEPVGSWNIQVTAVDSLGNNGTSVPVPVSVVASPLIVYDLVAYNSENMPATDFEAGDTVYAFFRLRYSSGNILTTSQYTVSVISPSGMAEATLTATYDDMRSGFFTLQGFPIPASGPGGAWSVAIEQGSLNDGFGNTGPGVRASAGADVVQVLKIPLVVTTVKLPLGLMPYLAVGLLSLAGGVIAARRYFTSRESPHVHRLFEMQADARPGSVAVVYGPLEVTYGDLEKRANRLARHMRTNGVAKGDIVAVLLPRSVDVYATILGILKAGAAYVPVDPEYPSDRVAYILRDSGAKALVTTGELAPYVSFTGEVIRVDSDHAAISGENSSRITDAHVDPGDLCYVIYTSGSTGRPKGVMVEHRNLSHLVRAESSIYKVRPEDRVYQGASLSFDLSVEEMWMAFNAGATLVAATPEMARAGPDLSKLLTENRVTVLSCVPTLLSILGESIPTLRLLILGGEACPRHLVKRWSRPELRIINTYGPTETTVIATYSELSPNRDVTIGRPVPGYKVHILDEKLQPVPPGETGEICIGGAGVARGYVGLPEQTRNRFVLDPFASSEEEARLYRTGDLGKFDAEGNIEFLGRADGQVKLRGFRIELSEIETVLMQEGGVLGAACTVREDVPGTQQLVAYIVPRDGGQVSEERLVSRLRGRLPAYMVPSLIETVDGVPMLPSGKLDRASLPPPRPRKTKPISAQTARTETERHLLQVWQSLFSPLTVSIYDDFFLDLGGHSLLVAQMVSQLRKDPRFARVSVSDVYDHPTIGSLASFLDSKGADTASATLSPQAYGDRPGDGRRHFLAGVVQGLSLFFVFATRCLEWLTPYVVFFILLESGRSVLASAAWAILSQVLVFPALLVIAVATKWIVLGKVKPGRHRLWGGYYLRWWFSHSIIGALPLREMGGTPLLNFVCRLLGARIGKNVYLGTDRMGAYDLVSIGDGSSIDELVTINGYTVENGELVIGPVTIGRGCFVGTWSVLGEYSVMEDGARLEDLSLLPRGARVPRGETWGGSPARPMSDSQHPLPPAPRFGRVRSIATTMLYAGLIPVFPIIFFLAILPGMLFLAPVHLLENPLPLLEELLAAPLVGGAFVFLFAVILVVLKWGLLGRVKAGVYPVHGWFYVRHWFIDQLLKLSVEHVGQVYATLYVAPWYRRLGAKLGKNVELSTAAGMTPDLLELDDGSTIADESSVGAGHVEGGWMTLSQTRLGRRAFIGNSGVVLSGTSLGDESLVGVLSIAPSDKNEAERKGVSWLGSPSILLPRRQPSASFSDRRTFSPSRRLRLARGSFELLRLTLPVAGYFIVAAMVVAATLELLPLVGLVATLLLLPAIYGASCLGLLLFVALAKWTLMGRYKPFVRPLWSNFIWRLELVNALYEFMAAPVILGELQGTPFLPKYLKLLGSKIGRRCYIDTTGFLEWDLVEIGDRAALMEDCIVQTHLFEDRVLKASRLRIGRDCSVGAASVVLYDSTMEDGSRLDSLSLLMKGETLPAGTAWAGIPATWQDPSHLPTEKHDQVASPVTIQHRRSRQG